MLSRLLDTTDTLALLEREEDHFYDKKSIRIGGAGLQKALVGFANSDGGDLIIGLEDAKTESELNKQWQGCATLEEFNGLLQAITEITPQIPCSMNFLSSKGNVGYILLIQIDKSSQVHQTSSKDIYIRKGAQTLPIKDPEQLISLKFSKGLASFEDVEVPNVPPEVIVESLAINKFLLDFSPKTDALEFCVNQNLLDIRTWNPKVCGLVLFAANPSSVIPTRGGVRITRYETKEDEPERDHLASSELLELPTYDLIHSTVNRISEIMSNISIWAVDGLKKAAYPPEAIWEIVVNAIIHRDYSISDDVQIKIFDNRIEVQSPGRLPGFVTIENILDVRYSRNKQIIRTLARYKTPPNKDMGEGLNTAFQKMKEWQLKQPIIEEINNSVLVTIPHTPLAKPEELVLEFLKNNSSITNKQGRDITGIKSENTMKAVFYALRDAGHLKMLPKGSKTEWLLANTNIAPLGRQLEIDVS